MLLCRQGDTGNEQPIMRNPLFKVMEKTYPPARGGKMLAMLVDEKIRKAGLLHMSGDEFMSPELIEDAIEGTLEVHSNIDLSSLVNQMKGDMDASGESR